MLLRKTVVSASRSNTYNHTSSVYQTAPNRKGMNAVGLCKALQYSVLQPSFAILAKEETRAGCRIGRSRSDERNYPYAWRSVEIKITGIKFSPVVEGMQTAEMLP